MSVSLLAACAVFAAAHGIVASHAGDAAVHIPEPMLFDMVRGLGARAGEFEVNALATGAMAPGNVGVDWAPEVEWAPRDGLALELELPLHNDRSQGLKFAVQGTFRARTVRRFISGWQVMARMTPGQPAPTVSGLYIAGFRVGARTSVLGMAGLRIDPTGVRARDRLSVMLNPSVFVELGERVTLGLEQNYRVSVAGTLSAKVLPQVHVALARRWKLQAGAGVAVAQGRPGPLFGLRLVFEL